ncbi:MAG: hypothetical protein Q4C65_08490 [Eubacteriales bacterium]|nr:hypothetical protein [Eubacteriales bacterium]
MGRVYFCLGKSAEVPYYFEKARVHVWSVEELCYFVRENAWILEEGVLGEPLAAWVGEQCSLPELSEALSQALRRGEPAVGFAETLFSYTGYCTAGELAQVRKILELGEKSSSAERGRARGDYFLEQKKYAMALREYEELLTDLAGARPEFLGQVYQGAGRAYAGLFLFDRAADAFERTWRMLGGRENARRFLTAKRLALSEQEYVDFLALHPELYQLSLELEERVRKLEEEWKESEQAAFLEKVRRAGRDGAQDVSRRMMQEKLCELEDEYRSGVER